MTDEEKEEVRQKLRTVVSAQVRYWMRRMNMDVKDLQEASGVSGDTIYKIRAGDRGANLDNVALLASGMGIPAFVLLAPDEL